MAEFAGLDPDPDRARAAAEQCTKARMRRFEWKQKLLRRPKGDAVLTGGIVNMLRGHSFVSKPNAADPLDALAPDIETRINERFAPLLSATK